MFEKLAKLRFQFYLSSIKSPIYFNQPIPDSSFNSTLVQLKELTPHVFHVVWKRFNSTLVQLKELCILLQHQLPQSFNSTLVQLKVHFRIKIRQYDRSFNSTLVQLKDSESGPPAYYRKRFNSTLVQLKEAAFILAFLFLVMFQFYLSSIKRLIQCHGSRTPSSFNSTLVQLKV